VGWGIETTWGEAWGTGSSHFYKPAGGESFKWNSTTFVDPSLGGASIEEVIQGTSTVGGEIPLPARYGGLEVLFENLLGGASSAISGDGHLHTFTPADALPEGLKFEIYRDMPAAKSFQAIGCMLSRGVFNIEKNAPLMFTPTFFGKSEEQGTKGVPTYPTESLIIPSRLVVTTGTFAGSVDVLSANIEVNNPLTEERFDLAAGGALKAPQRSDKRTVTGTIEGEFSEENQYLDWTGGVEGTIIWTWTGPLIAGTTYYKLVMTLSAVFTARPPQVPDAGPVRMTANIHGFKNGAVPEIKLELTNATADYTP
jgi:hypothetical protein